MNLPAGLKREFEAAGGTEVAAVARALYDLEGNLGETYIATDGRRLGLYSRRAGGSSVARCFDLAEISHLEIGNDGAFLHLKLQLGTGEGRIQLKFSAWDRAPLDQIAALWTKATGRTVGLVDKAADQTAARDPELTPLVAFCASLHTMISIDGHLDRGELLVLSRAVQDAHTVDAAISYVSLHGIDPLLSRLPAVLNAAQKRCLFANLIAVGMVDGEWRGSEQELLERYRAVLDIPDLESRALADVLMMKHRLAVLAQDETTPDGISELTPVSAFCASLHAMSQCDDGVAAEESEHLSWILRDPDAWAGGAQYLAEYGLDHLLNQLGGRLGPAQKGCLMANLLGVAMVDGRLRSREQEWLDRFQEALNFPAEDYAAIYDVLMTKNNLQVFA